MGRAVTDEKRQFAESILVLATALGFDLDEAVIGVYWHALKDVPLQIRREAMADAVRQKWFKFPRPADLVEACAKVMAEKRKAAAALHLADCDHSSHFIEQPDRQGVLRAYRCPCWQRAQQAMESVGQAIALPAVRDDHEGAA